ncbi:diacylglycerol/lipid kinase family protein [Bernardetia sp.]|uniref:diacylglycerol/lipid kinase family protein n=1 Tax=Bernardetia sp. TaxID=1937974 RepID=UPI0025C43512|nr:diacylglycerol kinase family protein [Bernardetia sp.]
MNNTTSSIIFLIINPLSGGIDKTEELQHIKSFVATKKQYLVSYNTTKNQSKDKKEIEKIYTKYLPQKVWIAGGDGTIKLVLEALFGKDIVFGILPLGSSNGLAKDLGLPMNLESCLKIAFQENFTLLDSISINNMKMFHLGDLGLNAALIKNYQESNARGKIGYAIQAIPTLREYRDPFNARITTSTQQIITEARVILIANSNKYGTGIVVNPKGKVDDDIFEIVIFKSLELLLILKILSGNLSLDDESIQVIQTRKALIQTDVPITFQIDGEFCGEVRELDIEMEVHKSKIATPKQKNEKLDVE